MCLSSASSLMTALMVSALAMVMVDAARPARADFFQVTALEIGPGQCRHKGVAAAGGADDASLQGRQLQALPAVVSSKDPIGPPGR